METRITSPGKSPKLVAVPAMVGGFEAGREEGSKGHGPWASGQPQFIPLAFFLKAAGGPAGVQRGRRNRVPGRAGGPQWLPGVPGLTLGAYLQGPWAVGPHPRLSQRELPPQGRPLPRDNCPQQVHKAPSSSC